MDHLEDRKANLEEWNWYQVISPANELKATSFKYKYLVVQHKQYIVFTRLNGNLQICKVTIES